MGHTPKMPRELSRQDFLRGAAGALAIGAVFGAPRASADPRADAWAQLARAIDGQVKLPADGGPFNAAKAVFNTNFGGMTPAAVVAPTSLTDVRKTMEFAASRGAHVAPRGGGHSYTGASTANGVMILDLRQLPGDIAYDAGTGRVTVTPATQLYAIHQVLAANGRGIPTGTCPTVGVAGHALGGGLGASSRRGGLLSDQLVSATVVLPGGTAVTASATENPDLFWGLRGGGGGNFGVTTSLTFATIPAGDVDVVNLHYPIQAFAQALLGWQSWLRTVGPESWALIDAGSNPTHAGPHHGDLPGRLGRCGHRRDHQGGGPGPGRDQRPHRQSPRAGQVPGRRQPASGAAGLRRRLRRVPDHHPPPPRRGSPPRSGRSPVAPGVRW